MLQSQPLGLRVKKGYLDLSPHTLNTQNKLKSIPLTEQRVNEQQKTEFFISSPNQSHDYAFSQPTQVDFDKNMKPRSNTNYKQNNNNFNQDLLDTQHQQEFLRVQEQESQEQIINQKRTSDVDDINSFGSTKIQDQNPQNLRAKVEHLFLYFCDYSVDRGTIFVKNITFFKILKDAGIIDDGMLTEKEVSLILSKELDNPTIKAIDFQSFLNVLVKIAITIYIPTSGSQDSLQESLGQLMQAHIFPLLELVEEQIENKKLLNQTQLHNQHLPQNTNILMGVSIKMIRDIQCSNEDLAIIGSILPVLWSMYDYYLVQNMRQKENIMKKLFRLLKDFEITPYMIHQKTCFLVYYYTTQWQDNQQYSHLHIIQRLKEQKLFLNTKAFNLAKKEQNPLLSFDQFLTILFRLSVIFFDSNFDLMNKSNDDPRKLLSLLSRVEMTRGFSQLVAQLRALRSKSSQLTLTPPRNVLLQLYLNQCQFTSQEELEYFRDSILVDYDAFQLSKMLIERNPEADPMQYTQNSGISQNQEFDQTENSNQMQQSQMEMEMFFEQSEDDLLRIFQGYCSYGDPLNTDKLKSQKLAKLFQDIGLLDDFYKSKRKQNNFNKSQNSLSFSNTKSQRFNFTPNSSTKKDQSPSQISQEQYLANQNNGKELEDHLTRTDLDLIFKKVVSQKTEYSNNQNISIQSLNKSQTMNQSRSPIKIESSSKSPSRRFTSFINIEVAQDQHSLDFDQFKTALLEASKIIYKNFNPYEACIMFVRDKILPLAQGISDYRIIHTQKIQMMLQELENDQIIDLLTDLHAVIVKVFDQYANFKGFLDFQQFLKFCTDYAVFPDVMSKAEINRVFQNLAFKSTEPSKFMNTSIMKLPNNQHKSRTQMKSTISSNSTLLGNGFKEQALLDQHLFVEALALCALHLQLQNNQRVLLPEQENIEKILVLIEKISQSEGMTRVVNGRKDVTFKGLVTQKYDLLGPIKKKYSWYFDLKNRDSVLSQSQKKQYGLLNTFVVQQHLKRSSNFDSNAKQAFMEKTPGKKEDLFGLIFQDQNK